MTQATTSISASTPKSGENSWLWLLKLVTGPFIIIFMLVHFIANHAIASYGLLNYSDIVAYYKIWVVPVMEIIFLGLVVSHSLLGLRSIIIDLHPSRGVMAVISWLFLIIGVFAFVYGTWLITVIVSLRVTL
jgi:succinate dehydrogenase hydrophobic anchor subunit